MKDQLKELSKKLMAAGYKKVSVIPGKNDKQINVHCVPAKLEKDEKASSAVELLGKCKLSATVVRTFPAYPSDVLILEDVREIERPTSNVEQGTSKENPKPTNDK